jgi:hypothetical protein
MVPAWAAWMAMEAPSPLLIATGYFTSPYRGDRATTALAAMWLGHYAYRILIFPFLGAGKKAPMPISVVGLAVVFNGMNGSINGYGLFHLDGPRPFDARFVVGAALFLAGFITHVRADTILRALRAPGEVGYKIPQGFLYRWVSCPNYLGETVEWCGYALAAGTLWPVSFAAWTFANLVPRAFAHHQWYRSKFPDYPPERRAIV